MKIINNTTIPTKSFGSIDASCVFMYDAIAYMKTYVNGKAMAICLHNGRIVEFDTICQVNPVEVTLTIEKYV